MEQIRSFIAIELTDELKEELVRLQIKLKLSKQPGVKWVDPYGIHLTLKFLGDVAADRVGEITTAMERAAQGVSPFHLEVKEMGAFPNLKRAQVAWVGVSGEVDKLGRLQQRLESHLAHLGFNPEPRPFTPHLTLARLRNGVSLPERQKFGQLIAGTRFEASCAIEVNAINLMRSQLTSLGAIYTRMSSAALK
jgi:2'-5' RNA ligase